MVLAKVALEIDVVNLNFTGEIVVPLRHSHLLIVDLGSCLILHALDSCVKLILEHSNCLYRVLDYELWEFGVELSEFIHVDIESVLSPQYVPHSLLDFTLIEIVLYHLLYLHSLLVRALQHIVWLVHTVHLTHKKAQF